MINKLFHSQNGGLHEWNIWTYAQHAQNTFASRVNITDVFITVWQHGFTDLELTFRYMCRFVYIEPKAIHTSHLSHLQT